MKFVSMQSLFHRALTGVSLAAIALTTVATGQFDANTKSQQPMKDDKVELGEVKWTRDLDAAKKQSVETGKPIFLQFQEVPG